MTKLINRKEEKKKKKKKEKEKEKEKEKKRKEEENKNRFHPQSNLGPFFFGPFSLPLSHLRQYYERDDNLLFKTFPSRTSTGALYKTERALLNTNSKIFSGE